VGVVPEVCGGCEMTHFVYGCTEIIALIVDERIIVFHLLIFVTMEDASMITLPNSSKKHNYE
jgi:hypothetical protein